MNLNSDSNSILNKNIIIKLVIILFISMSIVSASSIFGSEESISIAACQNLFTTGLDHSQNLMSSIMGLCLPGILVNLDRLQQNECEKILCEYDMAQKGLSPILCAKQAAYNSCIITGEGYDVIEGILVGSLRQQIRQILENPLGLGVQYVKDKLANTPACARPGCTFSEKARNIIMAGINIAEAVGEIKALMSQFEGLMGGQEEMKTACEKLEDIRPELEKVINEYYNSIN